MSNNILNANTPPLLPQKGLIGKILPDSFSIDDWMTHNVTTKKCINDGVHILCRDINNNVVHIGMNRVGILYQRCKKSSNVSGANFMFGDIEYVTGSPVCFVDFVSVFPMLHDNEHIGILALYEQPCFVIPLVHINNAPELTTMMVGAYGEFVTQCKINNNTKYNVAHVASGIGFGLASISLALVKECSIDGKKPNIEYIKFLVNAMYTLGLTARSVAKFFPDCHTIHTNIINRQGNLYILSPKL